MKKESFSDPSPSGGPSPNKPPSYVILSIQDQAVGTPV